MKTIIADGKKIRAAVASSTMTREKIISLVQDKVREDGLSFSLAGLDKLIKGELPKNDPQKIIKALADVMGYSFANFAEMRVAKTA